MAVNGGQQGVKMEDVQTRTHFDFVAKCKKLSECVGWGCVVVSYPSCLRLGATQNLKSADSCL